MISRRGCMMPRLEAGILASASAGNFNQIGLRQAAIEWTVQRDLFPNGRERNIRVEPVQFTQDEEGRWASREYHMDIFMYLSDREALQLAKLLHDVVTGRE